MRFIGFGQLAVCWGPLLLVRKYFIISGKLTTQLKTRSQKQTNVTGLRKVHEYEHIFPTRRKRLKRHMFQVIDRRMCRQTVVTLKGFERRRKRKNNYFSCFKGDLKHREG